MVEGNVRVAVRVRPLNARERLAGAEEVVLAETDGKSVLAIPDRHFTFDVVFGAEVEQATVFFELAQSLVDASIDGFNCTILAYGQTGSGKTFTMGTGLEGLDQLTIGIIPRAVDYLVEKLYQIFNGNMGSSAEGGEFFELYVSFLELYNEEIVDLLTAQGSDRADRVKRPMLTIREDSNGGICVAGIKEERVRNLGDITECLQRGTLGRTTKSTDMNLVSSRSHAIFTITIRQRRMVSDENGTLSMKSFVSKLHFVDLAGSERLKRTGAVGDRAKESISINSGLLALGNVISALGDETKRATHVPYRDSKLTRLLQDSLGGNSRTVMVACISPSSDNYHETVNTLKYANRARNIKNMAQVNEDGTGNAAFEIMQLKKQVAALKTEILQLRGLGLRKDVPGTPRPERGREGDELGRLRLQNRELQRRFDNLQKEKITIEAERDFYRSASAKGVPPPDQQLSVIKEHLKIIADLKNRIFEFENLRDPLASTGNTKRGNNGPGRSVLAQGTKQFTSGNGPSRRSSRQAIGQIPSSPGLIETPSWFGKANALIDKTRQELQDNMVAMTELRHNAMDELLREEPPVTPGSAPKEIFAAAVMARTETLLSQLQNDQCLKEELIVQLENSQQEYLGMRKRYEERVRLLQENVVAVQRERDLAVKSVVPRGEDVRNQRLKYEEKIKKMGRELNELKEKLGENAREAGTRTVAQETLIRNLRTAIQLAKAEKAKLQSKIDELSERLRADTGGQETETKELRLRERRAIEQARKYKKAYEFQKTLLQRRIEQYLQTKNRVRVLLNALRKHRVPLSPSIGNLLDSPSYSYHRRSGSTISVNGSGMSFGSGINSKLFFGSNSSQIPSQNMMMETPSRPSSGLASKSISAADLRSVERLTLQDPSGSLGCIDSDADPGDIESPALTNPMIGTSPQSTKSSSRRDSLIERGQPLLVPPGSEGPRSVLRMSPLLPRRKDLFARIADAASLSLASSHLAQLPSWSGEQLKDQVVNPEAIPNPDHHPSVITANSRQSITVPGVECYHHPPTCTIPASPMKIDDDDIIEFYRSSPVD